MKTRFRLTHQGRPLTWTIDGRAFILDRTLHGTPEFTVKRAAQLHRYASTLTGLALAHITVTLTPLDTPKTIDPIAIALAAD